MSAVTERDMQAIRDDLAYLRALAAEGRTAPLFGGSILLAAGVLFGLAALVHGLVLAGYLRAGGEVVLGAWIAAGVLFGATIFVIKRRLDHRPGAGTSANRAFGVVWGALGYAMFAIIVAIAIAAWRLDQPQIMGLLCCAIFAMYGAGWSVGAQLGSQKWLWFVALGSLAAAVALAFRIDNRDVLIWYAGALFLLVALPGALLMRQEPSQTV